MTDKIAQINWSFSKSSFKLSLSLKNKCFSISWSKSKTKLYQNSTIFDRNGLMQSNLILKAFNHRDRAMSTRWPLSWTDWIRSIPILSSHTWQVYLVKGLILYLISRSLLGYLHFSNDLNQQISSSPAIEQTHKHLKLFRKFKRQGKTQIRRLGCWLRNRKRR